jgi:DNA-binding transcriptional MerR regulator
MTKPPTHTKYLRIGQVAACTGVSAKALRLYEARGLLKPDAYSGSGYRLYAKPALARLNEIRVLKRAGFALVDIGKLLSHYGAAVALVETRIITLRGELNTKAKALAALEDAWYGLDSASTDINQQLECIKMSKDLNMNFKDEELEEFKRRAEIMGHHFTPKERAQMRDRAQHIGEAGMKQAQDEWSQLVNAVRAEMDAGTPADDPRVVDIGRRWHALVNVFTGGDSNIAHKLKSAYEQEPDVLASQGMSQEMFTYMRSAMRAAGLEVSP